MATFNGFVFYQDAYLETRFVNGTDRALIEAGIAQILNTRPGERVMMPEFGSRLPHLVFEPLDDVLKNQIKRASAEAILAWEDRLIIEDVDVQENEDNEHRMDVTIQYRFREDIQDVHTMELTIGV